MGRLKHVVPKSSIRHLKKYMAEKKPEPNVYFPKQGESTESLMKGLDNYSDSTPEEITEYRKKIDKGRVAFPKKGKKKSEDNTIQSDDR